MREGYTPEDEGDSSNPPQGEAVRYAGMVQVSLELIEQWLDLPKGVRLRKISPSDPWYGGGLEPALFYLIDETGEWLPEHELGAKVQEVVLQYRSKPGPFLRPHFLEEIAIGDIRKPVLESTPRQGDPLLIDIE